MTAFDYRQVLEAIGDAILAFDANHRVVFANRAVAKLLGHEPDRLIGRSFSELIPQSLYPNDFGHRLRSQAIRSDGQVCAVDLTISPIHNAGEELFVATLRPPEHQVNAASEANRDVLDRVGVGVIVVDGADPRVSLINPAAEQLLSGPSTAGMSPSEWHAAHPLEHLDGRPVDPSELPLMRTIERGESCHETLRLRRADLRERIFEIRTQPLSGARGGAVLTFSDVTRRYRLEQDAADRAAQLRALLDHLPVGVAYFDRMAVCRAGNTPARLILERSRSSLDGSTANDLLGKVPELRDALHRCIHSHETQTQSGVAWDNGMKVDSERFLDWRFVPLGPNAGRSRGALALIVDMTESARDKAELRRAMEAAEGASRRKTQFLSAVSHDLRTPVNALSLQAELLGLLVMGREDPGGELQMLSGDIRFVATNLIELINDLLDLTRFDSGVIDYQVTEFDLDSWLTGTLAPLELTARTKGLEFSWSSDQSGRTVRGDRVKMGRVLVNLVGNAVKFTEKGEVLVHAGMNPKGELRIDVEDTGSGIPTDGLEHIFDEFAQLRNPERDRTKGTGLGLAICRRLVEGVGGRLTVDSEVGRGTKFAAIYPTDHLISASEPAPEERPAASNASSELLPAVTAGSILLVEDDPSSRSTLARLLKSFGYRIAVAADGFEALASLETAQADLVLLDMMLPGLSGAEVLQRIRTDPTSKSLKVVILSGDVMAEQNEQLQNLHVDGILAKPVDLDALRALLSRLVPIRSI